MMAKKESRWIKITGEFDNLQEMPIITELLSRTCDYSVHFSQPISGSISLVFNSPFLIESIIVFLEKSCILVKRWRSLVPGYMIHSLYLCSMLFCYFLIFCSNFFKLLFYPLYFAYQIGFQLHGKVHQ